MDLRTIAVAETGFLHLKGPDGKLLFDNGKPVGINLYSPGTKQYAKAEADRAMRQVKMAREMSKEGGESPDDLLEDNALFLADVTHSFQHIERDTLQGHDLFLAVYRDRSIGFIAEQAVGWGRNWGNFSKGSRES